MKGGEFMSNELAEVLEQYFETTEMLLKAVENDEQELAKEYAKILRILGNYINKLINDAS